MEEHERERLRVLELENGDREGFSLETYRYIRDNEIFREIVNVANENLYSLRK